MTLRSRLLTGCALTWAATITLPALAQTVIETPPPEPVIVVTDPNAGRFAALPPGERKIAQSLYDAQTGTGTTAMSRDDIAAAKGAQGGWGQVFHSMQADGLVQQRNLGQVVSGGHHGAATSAAPVTISYGNGATSTAGAVTVKGGHRPMTTGVTTASGGGSGGGAGLVTTHGNSHGHAATIAASTTAGGGTGNGHGGGSGHGKR